MSLDLNIQPYYDDFDENNNFHKILFKPGVAVQARELTQAQSILQDQIGKLGKFVLADGSRVNGARLFTDTNVRSVSLVETSSLLVDMRSFTGKYVVGVTSGLVGVISGIDYTNFYINVKPINATATNNFIAGETLKIFTTKDLALQYVVNNAIQETYSVTVSTDTTLNITNASGSKYSNTLTINTFNLVVGDELQHASLTQPYFVTEIVDGLTCTLDKPLEKDITAVTITSYKRASRIVMEVSIDEGIFFTNGLLVKNSAQSIIPNSKTVYPSAVVGFQVVETIHDFIDDASLLDPALGSSNYSAPGADRLVVTLELVSKPLVGDALSDLTSEKFIELVRIRKGQIIKSNLNPKLGELENTLARQMYDHAGNFIVDDFNISFSEDELKSTSNTFSLQVSPGKAYVFGHEFELSYPYEIVTDKARSTASVTNNTLQTYYGNSIAIKDMNGFFNPQTDTTIELHANTKGSVLSSNTKIGTAGLRNFKYVTDNEFNLYLYDITLTNSQSIANVKSVAIPTTAGVYSAFNFQANTVLDTSNHTVLEDTLYQKIIFPYPHENISSISNVEMDTNIFLDNVTFSANVATISSSAHEILGGVGTLSNAVKNQYFFAVAKTTNGAYTAKDIINTDDITITISEISGTYTATLNTTASGKAYTGSAKVLYTARHNNATAKVKTLVTDKVVAITASSVNTPVSLGYADVFKISKLYKMDHAAANYKGIWSGATQYNTNDYVSVGSTVYKALYNSLNSSPSTNPLGWEQLTQKVSGYTFDNGQRESYYDHGTISLTLASDVPSSYIVVFDYFTHGAGSYISRASYPVIYGEIPEFKGTTGTVYKLRDCLDFRPRRTDGSSTLVFGSYEVPATTFTGAGSDYSYYLSRIDKLVLTDTKQFKLIQGEPRYKNFVPPKAPSNSLTIASITYDAYGFDAKDVHIAYESHKRYTMDDIGKLDKRIDRVEYYTTLSLAESDILAKHTSDPILSQGLKSGFLVDGFTGFAIGDTSNPEYNCAIDLKENCCRPITTSEAGKLQFDDETLTGLGMNDGVFYLPFVSDTTDAVVASNLQATGTINCNPFDTISFVGEIDLYPSVDTWFDVDTKPVINRVSDDLQSLDNAADKNILFDSFSYYNASTKEDGTTNITQSTFDQTSTVTTTTTNSSVSKTIEEVVQNSAAYVRSIPVRVSAERLAPYTKMYVFINGIMVNAFCSNFDNPLGVISSVTIANTGIGYSAANTIINFNGANAVTAIATANVSANGEILGVDLTNRGKGYGSNVYITVSGSGTGANVRASIINVTGNDLVTDQYGRLQYTVQIPNSSDLRFRTGKLIFSVSDNPLNPKAGSSYAEATFFAKGDLKVVQKIVTSIKPTTPTDVSGNGNGGNGDSGYCSGVGSNPSDPSFPPYGSTCVTDTSANTTYCVIRNGYKIGDIKPTFTTTSRAVFALDSISSPMVSSVTLDEFGYSTFVASSYITGTGISQDAKTDGVYSQNVVMTSPVGTIFNQESLYSLTTIKGGNSTATITRKELSEDKKTLTFKFTAYERYNTPYTSTVVFAVKLQGDISQFDVFYTGTKTVLTLNGSGNITGSVTSDQALGSNQYILAAQNTAMLTATAFSGVDFSPSNFVIDTQSINYNYIQSTSIDNTKYEKSVTNAMIKETVYDAKAQVTLDRLDTFAALSGTLTTVSTALTTIGAATTNKEITDAYKLAVAAIKADTNLSKAQKTKAIKDIKSAKSAGVKAKSKINAAAKLANRLTS